MIRAQDNPGVLTVEVDGPATMLESPAVHDKASDKLAQGVRALRFDLRGCTAMDSTFLGTLLSLERQTERVGGKLVLISPSARVLELLDQMGLEDFYSIETAAPLAGPTTELCARRPSTSALEGRILDAHDQLATAPGRAASQFGEVASELHRSPKGEPPPASQGDVASADRPSRPSPSSGCY